MMVTERVMTVEAVLEKLEGVRPNRGGWIARCPAHADRSPSLSVREGRSGVLLHCFAGCAIEAVAAAIGVRVAELFFSDLKASRREHHPAIVHDVILKVRSRLTPRENAVLGITVITCKAAAVERAMVRGLVLAVEDQELCQVAIEEGGLEN
jgi:hypothetical protein